MVTITDRWVQPALECSICGKVFHVGDLAFVVVVVPLGREDTICSEDWHLILASARAWLDREEPNPVERVRAVVQHAETMLYLELGH